MIEIESGEVRLQADAAEATFADLAKAAEVALSFGIPADAVIDEVRIQQRYTGAGIESTDVVVRWRRPR